MSASAKEAALRLYETASSLRPADLTAARIKQLQEDFILVRHALLRGSFVTDARTLESALAALKRKGNDRSAELQRFVNSAYGAAMSLS